MTVEPQRAQTTTVNIIVAHTYQNHVPFKLASFDVTLKYTRNVHGKLDLKVKAYKALICMKFVRLLELIL